MKFLCVADCGGSRFLEGATYDGHYTSDGMINLRDPSTGPEPGKIRTYSRAIAKCMLPEPEWVEENLNQRGVK